MPGRERRTSERRYTLGNERRVRSGLGHQTMSSETGPCKVGTQSGRRGSHSTPYDFPSCVGASFSSPSTGPREASAETCRSSATLGVRGRGGS